MTRLIGYLGPEGSYSHNCLRKIQQALNIKSWQNKICLTITDILEELSAGKINLALIPIENSLGGSVTESLDRLVSLPHKYQVLGEWVIQIQHCLLGFQAQPSVIRAHYQSLAQCYYYLKQNHPNTLWQEMPSNSAAVQSLLENNQDSKIAAIGSKEAASLYQVPILEEQINDSHNNFTRFWLLGSPSEESELLQQIAEQASSQRLISLAFKLPQDKPGSLANILNLIAAQKINLCRIESRPTRHNLGEYIFFIDFLNQAAQLQTGLLVNKLKESCQYFGFLGDYPVFTEKNLRFAQNGF